MIRYPLKAQRALGFLKRRYNAIEIYVEDRRGHNTYVAVFRRILGDGVPLRSVNQVGSRPEVLALCRSDQENDGRKRIYIIDGDCELLVGGRRPRLKHLYRLRAYCFENILLREQALIECCMLADPDAREHDLRSVKFEDWLSETSKGLLALYLLYGVAHQLKSGRETVSFNWLRLCDRNGSEFALSPQKVRARARDMARQLVADVGWETYRRTSTKVRTTANKNLPAAMLISAKAILLPLVKSRLMSSDLRPFVPPLRGRVLG